MLRSLTTLAIVGALIFVGATVKLGKRTLFGHVARIWQAEETQELVDGVKESSKPVVEKVKRGVKAGWGEIKKGNFDGGVADGDTDDGGVADGDTDGGSVAGPLGGRAGAGDSGGVLDGLRDRAAEHVADRAGNAAKDAVKSEVKRELGGGGGAR